MQKDMESGKPKEREVLNFDVIVMIEKERMCEY
jgi:hypothetical protein